MSAAGYAAAVKRIRNAVQARSDRERKKLANASGVPFHIVCRAAGVGASGRVNAEAYLALCLALGIDPVAGATVPPRPRRVAIWWALFGDALRQERQDRDIGLRDVVKEVGLSIATLSRAENGHPLSAAGMLTLCAWLGLRPEIYTQRRRPEVAAYIGELRAGKPPDVSRSDHCNTRRAAA